MFFRHKLPSDVLTLEFDFADFLEREGQPYADYTPIAADGVQVLSTWTSGSFVRLTITGGTAGSTYMVGARADTPGGATDTQLRMVHVRAPKPVEPYVPPPTATLYLVDETGALLVTEAGEALYIEV